jgi:hypothetical protein
MTLAEDYKTSVNEPETITDAQATDRRFGRQTGASRFRSRFGGRLALAAKAARNIERS